MAFLNNWDTRNRSIASVRRRYAAGFTLVQLLAVMAIIGILAAILFPVLAQAKERGNVALCISHLHSTGHSIELYQSDTDGYLPPVNFFDVQFSTDPSTGISRPVPHPLRNYGLNLDVGHCPRVPSGYEARLGPSRIDYMSKFTIDLTERSPKAGKYSYIPRPSNVLAWDWNHVINNNLTDPATYWTALRADGSVFRLSSSKVQHMYLVGGTWTLTVDPGKVNDYPFVYFFPGEVWPPDSTTQLQ
ncbi:MAG: type II secretion system protein [Fimbriimonas sp.]|nr:type II secretion system protein [Fimbriimonas sp.]